MDRIVIDAESNGLHGEIIAVGAVITSETGAKLGSYGGRVALSPLAEAEVSPWARDNVLRHFVDPDTETPDWLRMVVHQERETMLREFGLWLGAKSAGAHLWVDCGFPVEVAALHQMGPLITDNGRRFVVFHEIATIMLAASIDPGIDRGVFARMDREDHARFAHNPVWDSMVSSVCLDRLIDMTTETEGP